MTDGLYLPIYNSIRGYLDKGYLPFHMPGHKLGKGLPDWFARSLAAMDLTELPGTDNLHEPSGAILEAQRLAAKAFRADYTFFLINGSTCGVHAMIATICKPGDRLVVARDCHKSVINGMYLAGVEPVYVMPRYDERLGLATGISADDVGRCLYENPDAAGVLITRPTYYGVCCDIEAIARQVHERGKVLAVDEAHGAHLCFHEKLPVSAMEAGADMCVQSAHKTLPAFTQGAYLHARGNRVDVERLKFILSAIQSSSPSYPIMASLDYARAFMEAKGRELLGGLLMNCRKFRESLSQNSSLYSPIPDDIINGSTDETRLVVNVAKTGISGYEAAEILRRDFSVQPEMADFMNVVFIATVADSSRDIEKLGEALQALSRYTEKYGFDSKKLASPPHLPEKKMCLKDALESRWEAAEPSKARGRISRNMIVPYPPGIPVVNPGEIIDEDVIEYVEDVLKAGGEVHGLIGGKFAVVAE